MINKFDTYNESVRDHMKPKSMDKVLGDYPRLLDIYNKGKEDGLNVNVEIAFNSPGKRRPYLLIEFKLFQIFIYDYSDMDYRSQPLHADFHMKVSNINLGYNIPDFSGDLSGYSDLRAKINRLLAIPVLKESVRDMMKPKSEEEINKITDMSKILSEGIINGIPWMVKKALEEGAKITPDYLLWACQDQNYEIIKILIDNGADVNMIRKYSLENFMNEEDGKRLLKFLKEYPTKSNESVRDMMKPKSEEELIEVKKKYKDIIKSLKDAYPAGAYELMPNGKIKINWNKIVKKYGDVMAESIRLDIMKILKEYSMYTCYDRMYNEETFQKRTYGDLPTWTNESVRDMMKPKSEEEIIKIKMNKLRTKANVVFDFKELSMMWKYGDDNQKKEIEDYLNNLLDDPEGKEENLRMLRALIRATYPKKDYINTDLFKEQREREQQNESVRDMMTPKSVNDINQILSSKYNVDINIFEYLNDNGFRYIDAHNVDSKDLWKGIIFEYYNDKLKYRILFKPSDTLKSLKEKIRLYTIMLSDETNESVKDFLKPKSEEELKSIFPPVVDMVKALLDDNNIKYDVGLDRTYSDAYIEIYFEIGKVAYDLEIFKEEERWNNKYRLGTATGGKWTRLHISNDADDMTNFIKGLLPVKEGSETVGLVGSGSAVSGYPTGSFVQSAGQAVYGYDSDSAFAGSSNNTSVKIEVTKSERIRFKDMKQKKKKKDKESKIYNQIGKDIDDLHKPKVKTNNENLKTKFDLFKEEVDYEFMRKMNRDDNTPRYVGGFDRFIKLKDDDLKTRTSKPKSDKPTKPIESEFVDRKLFNGERAAIKYEKYNDFIDDIYTNIDNLIQEYKMEKVLMSILLFISHVNGGLVSRKKVFEFIECCDEQHGQKLRKLCWDYTYGKTETDRKFSSWHYIGLSFQRAMEELILTDETELNDVPDKNRRISSIYETTQKQVKEFDDVMKEYRSSGKIKLDGISTKTIKIRKT